MWVDKGREFYNKDFQKLFELYSTENAEKSCLIKRFNRTIKYTIFKYFTENSTWKYIDVLDKLVLLLILQATYLRAAKVNHIGESEARFSRSYQKASWK